MDITIDDLIKAIDLGFISAQEARRIVRWAFRNAIPATVKLFDEEAEDIKVNGKTSRKQPAS